MTIFHQFLNRLFGLDSHVPDQPKKAALVISLQAVNRMASTESVSRFYVPDLPDGVIPAGFAQTTAGIALDAANSRCNDYAKAYYGEMNSFIGYGTLSEMATRSEYRSPTTTLATEMTRKWIKLKTKGESGESDKISAIEDAMVKHNIQGIFRKAAEQDGFFGRAQIFIDIKGQENKQDLPLLIAPESIQKGSLKGFKNIEAIWTSPVNYESVDPTDKWFFVPRSWFVMGKQVHSDRLLTIISHPLPDILKPAFNFGGISMTQLLMPYVERWYRTSKSISDLLHSFSISGVKTNMETVLTGGAIDNLLRRAEIFNDARDNRGLMLLDKDTEEFFQFNTPLSGLDKLQAQAQEQMAAPCHIPLIKLLGITPSGLNSSSDEEIRVFYDYVHAMQEALFTDPLETVLKVIQLDLFGEIDEDITFEFEPLYELDGEALARVRKSDADAAQVLVNGGIISPQEERKRLASDPNSGYHGLDVDDVPERDDDEDLGQDGWNEGDHPRAENGQFGEGSGTGRKGGLGKGFAPVHQMSGEGSGGASNPKSFEQFAAHNKREAKYDSSGKPTFENGTAYPASKIQDFFDEKVSSTTPKDGASMPNVMFQAGHIDDADAKQLESVLPDFHDNLRDLRVSGQCIKHVYDVRPTIAKELIGKLSSGDLKPTEILPNPQHSNRALLVYGDLRPNSPKSKDGVMVVEVSANGKGTDMVSLMTAKEDYLNKARALKSGE